MRFVIAAFVSLAVISLPGTLGAEPVKQALVIGNSNYQFVSKLRNPRNDAAALAAQLERIGFRVALLTDVGVKELESAVYNFASMTKTADVVFVYYAGHGISVDGRNYIVPIDARLQAKKDLVTKMVLLDKVIHDLSHGKPKSTLFVLDACRGNPFGDPIPDVRVGRGLSEVFLNESSIDTMSEGTAIAAGTLIAFATGPGSIALDGTDDHSPFATALLRNLATPGVEVNSLFNRVRQDVVRQTGGEQLPWSQSAMVGDLYLAGAPELLSPARRATSLRAPPP